MIERIMLFKLSDPSERDALATAAHALLSQLPDVEELSVGLPADPASEKSWDLSVVLGCASAVLLDQVLTSALFESFLEQTMGGRYVVLKAWSFARVG